MFFTVEPDAYSAPPHENWMIPSDSATAKPRIAAVMVCEDETLLGGEANAPYLARFNVST